LEITDEIALYRQVAGGEARSIRAPHEQDIQTRSGSPVKPVFSVPQRAMLVQKGGEVPTEVVVGQGRIRRSPRT
jgi:hypothetical protein